MLRVVHDEKAPRRVDRYAPPGLYAVVDGDDPDDEASLVGRGTVGDLVDDGEGFGVRRRRRDAPEGSSRDDPTARSALSAGRAGADAAPRRAPAEA